MKQENDWVTLNQLLDADNEVLEFEATFVESDEEEVIIEGELDISLEEVDNRLRKLLRKDNGERSIHRGRDETNDGY